MDGAGRLLQAPSISSWWMGRDSSEGYLWGRASDDIWMVGGGVCHWDGKEWKNVVLGPFKDDLPIHLAGFDRVWASGPKDIFVTGNGVFHWNGRAFRIIGDAPVLTSLVATSECDITGVSGEGLFHWDGAAWSAIRGTAVAGSHWSVVNSNAGVWAHRRNLGAGRCARCPRSARAVGAKQR